MAKEHKVRAKGSDKTTRARAEKLLSQGADPSEDRFARHANYHVRSKSFKLMGSHFPDDAGERAKLCKDLRIKDPAIVKAEQEAKQAELALNALAEAITAEDAERLKGEPVPPVVLVDVGTIEG